MEAVGVALVMAVLCAIAIFAMQHNCEARVKAEREWTAKMFDRCLNERRESIERLLADGLIEMAKGAQDKLLAFSDDGRNYVEQNRTIRALEKSLNDAHAVIAGVRPGVPPDTVPPTADSPAPGDNGTQRRWADTSPA